MKSIIYARTSTKDQRLDIQLDALNELSKRMNYQQQNKWKQEAKKIEWLGVSNLWLVAEIDELVNSKKNEDPVSEFMVI